MPRNYQTSNNLSALLADSKFRCARTQKMLARQNASAQKRFDRTTKQKARAQKSLTKFTHQKERAKKGQMKFAAALSKSQYKCTNKQERLAAKRDRALRREQKNK